MLLPQRIFQFRLFQSTSIFPWYCTFFCPTWITWMYIITVLYGLMIGMINVLLLWYSQQKRAIGFLETHIFDWKSIIYITQVTLKKTVTEWKVCSDFSSFDLNINRIIMEHNDIPQFKSSEFLYSKQKPLFLCMTPWEA